MSETLYDQIRATVERMALDTTPDTRVEQFRHMSHDVTFDALRAAAKQIRELEVEPSTDGDRWVSLAAVLLVFGERL